MKSHQKGQKHQQLNLSSCQCLRLLCELCYIPHKRNISIYNSSIKKKKNGPPTDKSPRSSHLWPMPWAAHLLPFSSCTTNLVFVFFNNFVVVLRCIDNVGFIPYKPKIYFQFYNQKNIIKNCIIKSVWR